MQAATSPSQIEKYAGREGRWEEAAMFEDWLQEKLTIAEAEAAHMVQDERLGPDPIPFGFQHSRWRDLLSQMRDGDEIWSFASSPDSFEHNAGRAGTALVRNGQIVTVLTSIIN
jgi:hypothetical protein